MTGIAVLMMLASLLLAGGVLGDRYGRRWMLVLVLAGFRRVKNDELDAADLADLL